MMKGHYTTATLHFYGAPTWSSPVCQPLLHRVFFSTFFILPYFLKIFSLLLESGGGIVMALPPVLIGQRFFFLYFFLLPFFFSFSFFFFCRETQFFPFFSFRFYVSDLEFFFGVGHGKKEISKKKQKRKDGAGSRKMRRFGYAVKKKTKRRKLRKIRPFFLSSLKWTGLTGNKWPRRNEFSFT